MNCSEKDENKKAKELLDAINKIKTALIDIDYDLLDKLLWELYGLSRQEAIRFCKIVEKMYHTGVNYEFMILEEDFKVLPPKILKEKLKYYANEIKAEKKWLIEKIEKVRKLDKLKFDIVSRHWHSKYSSYLDKGFLEKREMEIARMAGEDDIGGLTEEEKTAARMWDELPEDSSAGSLADMMLAYRWSTTPGTINNYTTTNYKEGNYLKLTRKYKIVP